MRNPSCVTRRQVMRLTRQRGTDEPDYLFCCATLSRAVTARTTARGLTRTLCIITLFLKPCTAIGLPAIMAR